MIDPTKLKKHTIFLVLKVAIVVATCFVLTMVSSDSYSVYCSHILYIICMVK